MTTQTALAEPKRVRILQKLRSIQDAEHAVNEAKNEATVSEEKTKQAIAAAPVYLKRRMEEGRELPHIEVRKLELIEKEQERKVASVLQYVIAGDSLAEALFVDLMDLVLPRWDGERRAEGDW